MVDRTAKRLERAKTACGELLWQVAHHDRLKREGRSALSFLDEKGSARDTPDEVLRFTDGDWSCRLALRVRDGLEVRIAATFSIEERGSANPLAASEPVAHAAISFANGPMSSLARGSSTPADVVVEELFRSVSRALEAKSVEMQILKKAPTIDA